MDITFTRGAVHFYALPCAHNWIYPTMKFTIIPTEVTCQICLRGMRT